MSANPSATPAPAILSRLNLLARDIKISHSIFALPFALLATFFALWHPTTDRSTFPVGWTMALIVICMVLARTMAMAFNRWADARLDAKNPRTQGRAIPSGRLPASFMLSAAIACALAFIVSCAGFWLLSANLWPLLLSPLVLAFLAGYSYTKRFTWLCHLYLGLALALSPIAAVIAISPSLLGTATPWLLAMMVMCWVAGFDIIYAMQDVAADREAGTFSMPSRLGVEPALWISRLLHLGSLTALILLALLGEPFGIRFSIGIGIVAALLLLEHALVWNSKTHHIHMAFFTLNGLISLLLGTLGIWDIVTK